MDHGLAAKDGIALHKLICRLVRMVMTSMKRKMKPKSSLRKSFTEFASLPFADRDHGFRCWLVGVCRATLRLHPDAPQACTGTLQPEHPAGYGSSTGNRASR